MIKCIYQENLKIPKPETRHAVPASIGVRIIAAGCVIIIQIAIYLCSDQGFGHTDIEDGRSSTHGSCLFWNSPSGQLSFS